MTSFTKMQNGIEIRDVFDAEGRTTKVALRSIDGNIKEADVVIAMSPLNAGEAAPVHQRTVHFMGTSWSYITDSNSVLQSPNLGVVAVGATRSDYSTGLQVEGKGFHTAIREQGPWKVLSVALIEPISNLVLEVESEHLSRVIVSDVEGYIDVVPSMETTPKVLRAFGSDLSVSR